MLESLGFTVIEAADGDEAVDLFRDEHERITWVLMDMTMPRMDGGAALLKLREMSPNVVVILSSGWSETEVASRCGGDSPAGFLAKPFTLSELQAMLGKLGLLGSMPL